MTLSTEERGRITARVPQTVQDTLQQAAELLGATLNQFVVQAALSEARRVIERDRVIHLSSTDAAFSHEFAGQAAGAECKAPQGVPDLQEEDAQC